MAHLGHLVPALARFRDARILCLGDIMLDRYLFGRVDRISPEAPIPVLAVASQSAMPGGVGNVARNIAALGGEAALVSVVGDDEEGREVVRLLGAEPLIDPNLVTAAGRSTTVKTRYMSGGQQLLRADREDASAVVGAAEEQIIAAVKDEIAHADLLVLSDYAKGVLTERIVKEAIAAARAAGKPVLVDPKSQEFSRYKGASLLKPNARELARAARLPARSDAEVIAAGEAVLKSQDVGALLVTRSEAGMMLIERGAKPVALKARAREVFDVSGAGDTAIAALALGLAAGLPLKDAAAIANEAAGIAVGKRGTAVVFPQELAHMLHDTDLADASAKVRELGPARDLVAHWRAGGLRIAFTNGCFDLIHPGHVALLAEARAQGDRLVVGLNTDQSVKRLKGPARPINAEMARAIVLASLASVDCVVLFDEETPLDLIKALKPDVLVKGADYTVATVVGADVVQGYGGRVHLARLVPDASTTKTIEKILS
ncbi:MAG: D-glycero-beta-D-manno-heptose-7-phosphate kinase [Alphaproteobacteria bacterium]